jgi:L-ascorbate metabolism protein UlaG (beta-lactamase superfamily)
MLDTIHWLGHDSFRIDGSSVVYVDPWKLPSGQPHADVVLVTHDHYDHLSRPDIEKLAGPDTVIVGPAKVTEQLAGLKTITVSAGDTVAAGSARVTAVPAYNVNKFRRAGEVFHPRGAGYVGYIVDMDGLRIYHAGDTDPVPELEGIDVDVALLPVSGTYVMTADECVDFCSHITAKTVVPMHYGDIVGSAGDAERVKERCEVPVTILPNENA